MADIDAIIVGAGVIGLAIARELALNGLSIIVLEAEDSIGTGTSSRNSEVIHAGLYYPEGSLKAQLCVEGRKRLYDFCARYHIPHRRCGKLIVATGDGEVEQLEKLLLKGRSNGCSELSLFSSREVARLESDLRCDAALFSPETGIIDSHTYMLTLRGHAEDDGAVIAFLTPFESAHRSNNEFVVSTGGADPTEITCRFLINASGLQASKVAASINDLDPKHIPQTRFAKGNYFSLRGRNPFTHLVYPAPQIHGLGVHFTFDLAGQAKFGPDIEWVAEPNYEVDQGRGDLFYNEIRRYWPGLPDGSLSPAYAGIRPKIAGPEAGAPDFRIDGGKVHGVGGLINLFGIESPGLTASLAIAHKVKTILLGE